MENYYLTFDKECLKISVSNCEQYLNRRCIKCSQHHFLQQNYDSNTEMCLPVRSQIEWCDVYSDEEKCE